MKSIIKKAIIPLITRNKLREDSEIELTDNDNICIYTHAFNIYSEFELKEIETLFIKPARILLCRELKRRCKSAEIGEPFVIIADGRITLYFPVLEKKRSTLGVNI